MQHDAVFGIYLLEALAAEAERDLVGLHARGVERLADPVAVFALERSLRRLLLHRQGIPLDGLQLEFIAAVEGQEQLRGPVGERDPRAVGVHRNPLGEHRAGVVYDDPPLQVGLQVRIFARTPCFDREAHLPVDLLLCQRGDVDVVAAECCGELGREFVLPAVGLHPQGKLRSTLRLLVEEGCARGILRVRGVGSERHLSPLLLHVSRLGEKSRAQGRVAKRQLPDGDPVGRADLQVEARDAARELRAGLGGPRQRDLSREESPRFSVGGSDVRRQPLLFGDPRLEERLEVDGFSNAGHHIERSLRAVDVESARSDCLVHGDHLPCVEEAGVKFAELLRHLPGDAAAGCLIIGRP